MGMLVIGINYKPDNNMKIIKIRYNVYEKIQKEKKRESKINIGMKYTVYELFLKRKQTQLLTLWLCLPP